MEPITVGTRITEEDVIRASFRMFRKRFLTDPKLLIAMLALTMVIFANAWQKGPLLFGFFLFLLAGVLVMVRISARAEVKKKYHQHERNKEWMVYTFDADGFSVQGDSFHVHTPWKEVAWVERWEDLYLIQLTKESAQILPSRSLNSEQEQRLCDLFDEVCPGWRK